MGLVGGPGLAVIPVGGLLAVFLLTRLPLRYPALAVACVMLVLDNPVDHGAYTSPFLPLAELLALQLKKTIPVGALVLSGADAFLLFLAAVYAWRRVTANVLDVRGRFPAPAELFYACWIGILGPFISLGWGLIRGGQMQWANWQLERVLHLPIWMMLFAALLRGSADQKLVERIIVWAAMIHALAAILIRQAFPNSDTATSHSDSILFAVAFLIFLIRLLERPNRRHIWQAVGFLPFMAWGMVANDRRIVWANVLVAGTLVFFLTRWSSIKLRMVRLGLLSLPAIGLYILVGWNSGSRLFKPVANIKSMVVPSTDSSSEWREIENYNLYSTFMQNPLLGPGWGHPMVEAVPLPDVSGAYLLEPYVPHNSVLGIWGYTGLFGFLTIWMPLIVGVYFALLAYRHASTSEQRAGCMTSVSTAVVFMLQGFGDMGVGSWPGTLLVGMTLPLTAKIAVETGAWPIGRKRVTDGAAAQDGFPSKYGGL